MKVIYDKVLRTQVPIDMVPEQPKLSQIEADSILDLALQPASDAESEDARIIRRILRREIEDILSEDSNGESQNLDRLAVDLDKITNVLQEKISRDDARSEEIKELIALLKKESFNTERSSIDSFPQTILLLIASTAVVGGLVSGVPGAIVATAAIPFFLKFARSITGRAT